MNTKAKRYEVAGQCFATHRADPTWQHCHEWAARIEALFNAPFTDLPGPDGGQE